MNKQVDINRTEDNFDDFTAASKLLEVSRLSVFMSILMRSSGDLGGIYFVLSHTPMNFRTGYKLGKSTFFKLKTKRQ